MTGAESEILELVSVGLDTRAIARRLLVSELTVQSHVRNAARKLGVRTRLAAAVEMLRERGELERRDTSAQRFVVVDAEQLDASVEQLASASYEITALPPSPWHFDAATVGHGTIASDDDVERALIAGVRGMSLLLAFDEALLVPTRTRLLHGLERLGTIQVGSSATAEEDVGVELAAGLQVLAAGGTIADAARTLHVSERTLHRQLAALRRRLDVRTNAAAARAVLARRRGA